MSRNLRVDDLTKKFGTTVAVDDVSLRIREGEFFTLLGPSGCGKTTTLRCISGLESPTEGAIYIGDTEITDMPIHKRGIGMIFQNYGLLPHLNVEENIAFGLKMQGDTENLDKRVTDALEMVQLEHERESDIGELSGGQQQRIAVARSIVIEPTILLSDEPLGALDLKLRQELQVELKNIQERLNITTLHVTHDQQEALTMSDRIAVMNDGKIVQIGKPRELYENPKNEFISNFIGRSNVFTPSTVEKNGAAAILRLSSTEFSVDTSNTGVELQDAPLIAVRPENIRMSIDSNMLNIDALFKGEIEDIVYQGERTLYSVRTDWKDEVLISQQRQQPVTVNQTVSFGWKSNEAVVLEEE